MNIKEELTCSYCHEIYNQPVMLNCCGDHICKQHIEELIANKPSSQFICPLCNRENENQILQVNKFVRKMIETELHKFQIDSKHRETLEKLKKEIQNLEEILKNPKNMIHDEICELKRQVDLDRDKLKSEIDKSADGIVQQLDSYEKKFKKEFKFYIDSKYYNSLLVSFRIELVEYEKCLNLFSVSKEDRDVKWIETEKVNDLLQSKIKEAKINLFSNKSFTYKPIENKIEDLFGRLIVKVRFDDLN
jgi:hypothetical protein